MKKFKGAGVALVTPFTKNLAVDYDALKKLVQYQLKNNTDYLVVLGTTGESPIISDADYRKILDTVLEENNGKLPIVVGMGGNHTHAIQGKYNSFNFDGVDAILSVSPYYNKPNQNGIVQHYRSIADNAPKPIILYNVPGRTGSNMSAETTLKLAEHNNIIAMKEASGNFSQCMEIIQHKPTDFLVISGDDAFTLPFIAMGMDGVISVICNAFPKPFAEMVNLALIGNIIDAKAIHYNLLNSMNLIFEDGSPGGIKEQLQYIGICENTVHPPLFGVNDNVKAALVAEAIRIQSNEILRSQI